MNRTMEYLYYIKMVYLNAGRALMKENYSYYANLVNKQRVKSICENIYKKDCDFYLSFRDTAGCAAQEIFCDAVNIYREKCNVFVILDCYGRDNSILGILAVEKAVFLFSDYEYKFRNIDSKSLAGCYHRHTIPRHSARKLRNFATEYFEKSEHIAKTMCL